MAREVNVSRLDSPHVHAAARGTAAEAGRVIAPARTLCGIVLTGELVDTSARPLTCQPCFRERHGRSPNPDPMKDPLYRRLFRPGAGVSLVDGRRGVGSV